MSGSSVAKRCSRKWVSLPCDRSSIIAPCPFDDASWKNVRFTGRSARAIVAENARETPAASAKTRGRRCKHDIGSHFTASESARLRRGVGNTREPAPDVLTPTHRSESSRGETPRVGWTPNEGGNNAHDEGD